MARGKYKYICLDCGEATHFSRQERIRSSGMRCRFCGCRALEPSKASFANNNIPIFHDKKVAYDTMIEAKQMGHLI